MRLNKLSQNNVIKELFDKPISKKLWVAPMAGVTDRPFRTLCKYFGAGHAVSEMMNKYLNKAESFARKKQLG